MMLYAKFGPVVLKKKIFKYSSYIFIILLLSPLEEGHGLYLYKFEFHIPKDALCQIWLKLAK